MPLYSCIRCGYETTNISNLKKHITKKYPCIDILKCNLSPEEIIKSYEIDRSDFKYPCDGCNKTFATDVSYFLNVKNNV